MTQATVGMAKATNGMLYARANGAGKAGKLFCAVSVGEVRAQNPAKPILGETWKSRRWWSIATCHVQVVQMGQELM